MPVGIVGAPVSGEEIAYASETSTLSSAYVEEQVKKYFSNDKVMHDIAWCESRYRQYDSKGNPLIGEHTHDVGVFQINEIHFERANELGMDIHTLAGNLQYAELLYETQGTKPWYSSAKCWENIAYYKAKEQS